MDQLDKMLEIINVLIWPIFALIALFIFRKPVSGLFGRLANIQAEAGGFKLSASLQDKFSPETIKLINKDPTIVNFKGETRQITAVSAYTRGYTGIYETLDPQSATRYVQIFLKTMQEIAFKYGGTIDRYDGARIIVYWGAPVTHSDDAKQACAAALEMKAAVSKLSPELESQGLPKLNAEFSITTANVMVGDFGTGSKTDYSVMGEYIGILNRIGQLNINYQSNIVVTQYTYAFVKSDFEFKLLSNEIKIKGKNEPISVYELIGSN